jgi:exosortase
MVFSMSSGNSQVHTTDAEPGRRWLLWLIVIQLAVLFVPDLLWLWDRWTMSVWHNGHGLLITAVVGYLIRQELSEHKDIPVSGNAWGFLVLIPALLLHMLDAGIHSQLLSAAGLVLALPGLSLLFLGYERTKLIIFPLIMLLLTLPIPLAFTESLHLALRYIATDASAVMLPIFGVPVFVQGTTLDTPNGTLQVADACSGFSTLYASIAVGCMVAYFCPDWRRKIIVLLVAAPLAIAVNIVRVIALTLLVHWFGIDVLRTSAHEISGLVTFMVALPLIFWIGNVRPAEEGAS